MKYLQKFILITLIWPFFSTAIGCEDEFAIFDKHINLSSCKLAKAIEARVVESLTDVQISRFYYSPYSINNRSFPAYGELMFTAIYVGDTFELQDKKFEFTCPSFFLSAGFDLFFDKCSSEQLRLPLFTIPIEREWDIAETLGEIEIFNHHLDLSSLQLAQAIEAEKPYLKDIKIIQHFYAPDTNMKDLPAMGSIIFTAMFKKRKVIYSCSDLLLFRGESYNNDLLLTMSCSEGIRKSFYKPLFVLINLSESLNIEKTKEEIRTNQEIIRPVQKELIKVSEPQERQEEPPISSPRQEIVPVPSSEQDRESRPPQVERNSYSPLHVPFSLVHKLKNKIISFF